PPEFLSGRHAGTGFRLTGWSNRVLGSGLEGQMMAQRLQPWRSGRTERQWLSKLIDTMERIARPEVRALPNDQRLLAAVRAQLARPASYAYDASAFSLRN